MPCYHPLHGYKSRVLNPTGKRSLVFKLSQGILAEPVSVPCGRCIGCRLELSRQWAMRCVHEAQLHSENAFITLTYDEAHLPHGGTLIKKHFQDFMKRLRRKCGKKISFYHCGEYGECCKACDKSRRFCRCEVFLPGLGRPHYHALIFGLDFPDKVFYKKSADGSRLYTSEYLQSLWPDGFVTTGALTFESAAYCARYTTAKLHGEREAEYLWTDRESGECVSRCREYNTMSNRCGGAGKPGGIGANWYTTFKSDVYPRDEAVLRGMAMKPPKYYDRLLELEDPVARAKIRESRMAAALLRQGDNTTRRLLDREQVKLAQAKFLKRGTE